MASDSEMDTTETKESNSTGKPSNIWLFVIIIILILQVMTIWRLTLQNATLAFEIQQFMQRIEPPGNTRIANMRIPPYAPLWGNKNAPVKITVFSDFECSACAQFAPTLGKLKAEFGDTIAIYFRNNPLPFHKEAPHLAIVGLLANQDGKFWAYHDSIFANNDDLGKDRIDAICQNLGIKDTDIAGFELSRIGQTWLDDDLAEAKKLNISATPTVFINGRRLVGGYPLPVLEKIIREELRQKDDLPVLCE